MTWVLHLGQEDPMKEGVATHTSILAQGIPWTLEPGQLQSIGSNNHMKFRYENSFLNDCW